MNCGVSGDRRAPNCPNRLSASLAPAAGSLQTIVASPKFRGHPRYSRVAVVPAEGDEVWRGELRLLFKAYSPVTRELEQLALVKFFVTASAGVSSMMPASVLTHTYDWRQGLTSGNAGVGSSRGSGQQGGAAGHTRAPQPRHSATGRYTGAVRLRFPPAGAAFRHKYQVMPVHNIIRAEHVLTDYNKHGLSGAHEAFYVNPWKFALENVADDEGRGEALSMPTL